MTPKQEERIRLKIKKIKAALAADKRQWGGYHHDGQGLRYLPPRFYLQLKDYTGGLRYFNWFQKTFPDDVGYPDFLFEWSIILFKRNRLKAAESKVFETFCQNTYIFDKYFKNPIVPIEKWEGSNLETSGFALEGFEYAHDQDGLQDFSEWLKDFVSTEKFQQLSQKYIEIQKKLKTENDYEKRVYLIKWAEQLHEEFQT